MSGEVRLKIISQMIQVLLVHDRGFDNSRRGAREIDPAQIAPNNVQVLRHLPGANRRLNGALKGAHGICVRGFKHGRSTRRFVLPARVVPGNGQLEEGEVFRSGSCSDTRRDAGASMSRKFVSEIIQNVSVGRSRMGEHFVGKDL